MSKIAILTNFMEFNAGYSLTGIVKDQAMMLSRYNHEVHLFVNEQFGGDGLAGIPVHLQKKIPFSRLIDYRSKGDITNEHKMLSKATAKILKDELADFDFVFAHDFVFTGWNLPYGMGCIEASKSLPKLRWMHWIHSVPTAYRDWWAIREYGNTHKLVYPNNTDRLLVAEQYRGAISDVRAIHHIKDLRSYYEFCDETCEIIDRIPGIMQADIVQILPASVDRLIAKRVREVILIFSHIKQMGEEVCLVIANQWATSRQRKEDVAEYKKFALDAGLSADEMVFTSDLKEGYEAGIPHRVVRELFLCSNLFIFPTREESFGLVMPEAALSGAFIVTNKSLDMQREILGNTTLSFDFGSYNRNHTSINEERYLEQISHIILGRMIQNESIKSRTFSRQKYNWDYLYTHEYAPVMAEAALWSPW